MKATTRDTLPLLQLLGCAIGVGLMASSSFLDASRGPTAEWSALFGGALLIRLSLSAALNFRDWKARAEMGLGLWLIASPWLLDFERLPSATAVHYMVGLATVGLGALGLWDRPNATAPWSRRLQRWLGAREASHHGRARAC